MFRKKLLSSSNAPDSRNSLDERHTKAATHSSSWTLRSVLFPSLVAVVSLALLQPWLLLPLRNVRQDHSNEASRETAAGDAAVETKEGNQTATLSSKPPPQSKTTPRQKGPAVLTLENMEGFTPEDALILTNVSFSLSRENAEEARKPLLDILNRAGLSVNEDVMRLLPTWSEVTELYGSEPIIFGTETCQEFRDAVPLRDRYLGCAGQFNTGTNALFNYLNQNLEVPGNEAKYQGMLWSVPWHKHSWASLRYQFMLRRPDEHYKVMPVVMIRDPYFWMDSMCDTAYGLIGWNKSARHCPNLIEEDTIMNTDLDEITTGYPKHMGEAIVFALGNDFNRTFSSILHSWTEFYREYLYADYPRLIVRFEDLLYHTEEVLKVMQQCVGAQFKSEHIAYPTKSAKNNRIFNAYKAQNGFISALIKNGQDRGRRRGQNMTSYDRGYAKDHLDTELMDFFRYTHPVEVEPEEIN